jgi:AGZA family xanthine/uracil permease-like MFS transporter
MGGRIGYSAATGLMVIVLSWFGIIALLLVAGARGRDLADPALHRHADRRAGVPGDAAEPCARDRAGADPAHRGLVQDSDRRRAAAAGTNAATVGFDKLGQVGVLYHGLEVLAAARSSRASCSAPVGAFVVDKKYARLRLRGGWCGADLLRLHARRVGRLRGDALGRDRLCDRGGFLFVLSRAPETATASCRRCPARAWQQHQRSNCTLPERW